MKQNGSFIEGPILGLLLRFAFPVLLAWLSFFHGALLAGLFARDRAVIGAAADYLRAYAIDTLLTSILFCFIGYFNGRGNTALVMAQGIVGAFLVRVPVSLFHVGLATPCSTVVQIGLFFVYYALITARERKMKGLDLDGLILWRGQGHR